MHLSVQIAKDLEDLSKANQMEGKFLSLSSQLIRQSTRAKDHGLILHQV